MLATIQKSNLKFCASHFLTEEFGKCVRLHGHDYDVIVSIKGEIKENGAVMDFSILKKVIRRVILPLEHKILVPTVKGFFTVMEDPEKPDHFLVIKDSQVKYRFPKDLTYSIPKNAITAENLATYLLEQLKQQKELQGFAIQVLLGETPNNHVLVGDF